MNKALLAAPTPTSSVLVLPDDERIDADVKRNLAALVRDKNAFADNTWSSFESVISLWARWCADKKLQWLPIEAECMREYLMEMHTNGLSVATVRQHYSMMCKLHRHAGLPSLVDNPAVNLAMKNITRTAVQGGERTGQAIPFRLRDLHQLAQAYGMSKDLADKRDLAFLSVAYNTLLRISELSRVTLRDVENGPDGRYVLRIGYTKTTLTPDGVVRTLSKDVSRRLKNWIDASGITDQDQYIFCPVDRWGKPRLKAKSPLTNAAMEKIFSRAWRMIRGLPGEPDDKGRYAVWTGHSARVGAAQDMTASGSSLANVMKQGGWKRVDMVMRYIRNLEDADNDLNRMLEGDR